MVLRAKDLSLPLPTRVWLDSCTTLFMPISSPSTRLTTFPLDLSHFLLCFFCTLWIPLESQESYGLKYGGETFLYWVKSLCSSTSRWAEINPLEGEENSCEIAWQNASLLWEKPVMTQAFASPVEKSLPSCSGLVEDEERRKPPSSWESQSRDRLSGELRVKGRPPSEIRGSETKISEKDLKQPA